MVGQKNLDEIHIVAGEKGAGIVRHHCVIETPGTCSRPRPLHIRVTQGGDTGRRIAEVSGRMKIGNPARADEADSHRCPDHDVLSSGTMTVALTSAPSSSMRLSSIRTDGPDIPRAAIMSPRMS